MHQNLYPYFITALKHRYRCVFFLYRFHYWSIYEAAHNQSTVLKFRNSKDRSDWFTKHFAKNQKQPWISDQIDLQKFLQHYMVFISLLLKIEKIQKSLTLLRSWPNFWASSSNGKFPEASWKNRQITIQI